MRKHGPGRPDRGRRRGPIADEQRRVGSRRHGGLRGIRHRASGRCRSFCRWSTRSRFATSQAAARQFSPNVVLVHLFAYHLSPAVLWPLGQIPTVMMVLDYKVVCPLGSKLLPDARICEQRAGLDLLAVRLPDVSALATRPGEVRPHQACRQTCEPGSRVQSPSAAGAALERHRLDAPRRSRLPAPRRGVLTTAGSTSGVHVQRPLQRGKGRAASGPCVRPAAIADAARPPDDRRRWSAPARDPGADRSTTI